MCPNHRLRDRGHTVLRAGLVVQHYCSSTVSPSGLPRQGCLAWYGFYHQGGGNISLIVPVPSMSCEDIQLYSLKPRSVQQFLSRLHLDQSTFAGPHLTSAERNSRSPEMVLQRTCLWGMALQSRVVGGWGGKAPPFIIRKGGKVVELVSFHVE